MFDGTAKRDRAWNPSRVTRASPRDSPPSCHGPRGPDVAPRDGGRSAARASSSGESSTRGRARRVARRPRRLAVAVSPAQIRGVKINTLPRRESVLRRAANNVIT